MWEMEVRHEGLHKYKIIRGSDKYIVEEKAKALKKTWIAIEKTKEAEIQLELVKNILISTLKNKPVIVWDNIIDRSDYPVSKPQRPKPTVIPLEPKPFKVEFNSPMNLIVRLPLLKLYIKDRKQKQAEESYKKTFLLWSEYREKTLDLNKKTLLQYQRNFLKWEEDKNEYIKKRDSRNQEILSIKNHYLNKDLNVIEDYCRLVLSLSVYPDTFPEKFDVIYNKDTKMLLVDYFLPSKDDLPRLKEIKYNVSRDEFVEKFLTNSAFNNLYDDVLYQMVLKVIYELYETDTVNAIEAIALNGNVSFVEPGTGQNVTSCIMSIVTVKKDFTAINLEAVNPKDCFKRLKGVGSSKLHGLVPVTPIVTWDKNDRRFVAPHNVIGGVNSGTNLAAMDWQDFENLIRDVFEKEFCVSGGEVKITRASRDEGVDAVIFDPDPIKGGKIVVQAKRYTNTVGVSAVRDLYGTVLNEGAMKGILVTTADYGPDAYNFAKDKPITLLNGGHLLHILKQHGHEARIDLAEAKKMLNEE